MRPWHLALILIIIVCAVFAEVRYMQFLDWDDQANVFENPWINPVSASGVAHFWKAPYFGFYIPVTRTVWAGLAWLARTPPNEHGIRLDPAWFHLANVVVHVLNTLLVLAILRLLIRADGPAFAGAALFALHPIQVEPVCWVTGMKDLLGAFFALCAIWQYLRYARGPDLSRWRLALSVLLFAVAVLAKPTAVVAIVIAWVLDHFVLGRSARDATRSLALWVPVAAGAAILTKVFNGPDPEAVAIWARPLVAADALAFYLSKLAWPVGLCANYTRKPALVLSSWWGYATWLAPVAVAAILIIVRRRLPVLTAAGLVFGLALLPVLGLVPFSNPDVCDRFMYLAMLGPALALAFALHRWPSRHLGAITVIVLVALTAGTLLQTCHWHTTSLLFERVLAVNPRSWVAHTTLANDLMRRGYVDDALPHLELALAENPDYPDVHDSLGIYMQRSGEPEEALPHHRRALELNASESLPHFNFANALKAAGHLEESLIEFQRALQIDPTMWNAHNNMAALLVAMDRPEDAIPHFEACIAINPDYEPGWLNLASVLARLGREDEARRLLERARTRPRP